MEYTLEDTYEDLKELQEYLHKEIEDLAAEIDNNRSTALYESCTLERVKIKQYKMAHQVLKHIPKAPPAGYPIPKTTDIYTDALNDLQKEIFNAQELVNQTREQLQNIEKDITYLENKKEGFNKMREMYLASAQTLKDKTYEDELCTTKKLFKDVRQNLHDLVRLLFPQNKGFEHLLTALTAAYEKGGDDIYVNVVSETLDCVKYLVEADIVAYHPNDKTKIRMVDLL